MAHRYKEALQPLLDIVQSEEEQEVQTLEKLDRMERQVVVVVLQVAFKPEVQDQQDITVVHQSSPQVVVVVELEEPALMVVAHTLVALEALGLAIQFLELLNITQVVVEVKDFQ